MLKTIQHIGKYSFFFVIASFVGGYYTGYLGTSIGIIAGISKMASLEVVFGLNVLINILIGTTVFYHQTRNTIHNPYLTAAAILVISNLILLFLMPTIFLVICAISLLTSFLTTYITVRKQKRGEVIPAQQPTNSQKAYYPVSTLKLALMQILTLGWYKIFWWYKNWQYIRFRDQLECNPKWRAIFALFFYHEFLENVNQTCAKNNVAGIKYPRLLITYYWVFVSAAFLIGVILQIAGMQDPAMANVASPLLGIMIAFILVPTATIPQAAINRCNQATSGQVEKGFKITAAVGILIVIFSIVWIDYLKKIAINSRSNIKNAEIAFNYRDFKAGYKYAILAAKKDDPEAQFLLGELYYQGVNGVKKDQAEAQNWFEKAANQGYAKAQYALAALYYEGDGIAHDDNKAVYWLQKAADAGNADAISDLGFAYNKGKGVEKNHARAMELYQKAAEKGSYAAMYNLALNYRKDPSIANHNALAVSWFEKSLQQEPNACAANDLAILYATGEGVSSDTTKAKELFKEAARIALLEASMFKLDSNNYADRREIAKAYAEFAYAKARHINNTEELNRNFSPLAISGANNISQRLQATCWE